MTLTRWSPVAGLAALEIDGLNRMLEGVIGASGAWVPAVDVYETPNQDLIVKADLPDVKREAIKVTVENDVLTIEGDRATSADVSREQYHRVERGSGTFKRSFT